MRLSPRCEITIVPRVVYHVIKISSKTTGQILNERESLLRVIRVIALIARRDDARATSRVDNESHGASANARGIQSPGRGHVVGIVSRAHPERAELVRVGKRAIHVCRACHA